MQRLFYPILLCCLLTFSSAIKPIQLINAISICDGNQTPVSTLCVSYPLQKSSYGKSLQDCADDLARSQICFNTFNGCVNSLKNFDEDIPVHCWNCLVASPAESEMFKQYQECLVKNFAYHNVGLGLVMLVALAVMLA